MSHRDVQLSSPQRLRGSRTERAKPFRLSSEQLGNSESRSLCSFRRVDPLGHDDEPQMFEVERWLSRVKRSG